MPAYTTIRNIIIGVAASSLEESFRKYSLDLADDGTKKCFISFDGKVLRGSFDHFKDQKAIQILSAFISDNDVIVQVKGNQKTLLQDCIETSETTPPADVYQEPFQNAIHFLISVNTNFKSSKGSSESMDSFTSPNSLW